MRLGRTGAGSPAKKYWRAVRSRKKGRATQPGSLAYEHPPYPQAGLQLLGSSALRSRFSKLQADRSCLDADLDLYIGQALLAYLAFACRSQRLMPAV